MGKKTGGTKVYSFYLATRGVVVHQMLYPLHNCKPKGISSSGVESARS